MRKFRAPLGSGLSSLMFDAGWRFWWSERSTELEAWGAEKADLLGAREKTSAPEHGGNGLTMMRERLGTSSWLYKVQAVVRFGKRAAEVENELGLVPH